MKPLTSALMLVQLVRLNDLWPKYGVDDEMFRRLVSSYKDALDDVDADAVEGGVGIWIRTATNGRWPSPAQVRECAMRWLSANRDFTPLTRHSEGCNVCHAPARWAVLAVEDWQTKASGTIERMIQPCHAEVHAIGQPIIPFPPNFIRWAPEATPQEVGRHEPTREVAGPSRTAQHGDVRDVLPQRIAQVLPASRHTLPSVEATRLPNRSRHVEED